MCNGSNGRSPRRVGESGKTRVSDDINSRNSRAMRSRSGMKAADEGLAAASVKSFEVKKACARG